MNQQRKVKVGPPDLPGFGVLLVEDVFQRIILSNGGVFHIK